MQPGGVRRVPVLVAASGAQWESDALRMLEQAPDLVLHGRSVDLPDLVASAGTGLARCAVVAHSLAGLDADTVAHLDRAGVRVVAVLGVGPNDAAGTRERLARIGVARSVEADLGELCSAVREVTRQAEESGPLPVESEDGLPGTRARGRLTAVWGPGGAPGRTTVATALAAELAGRGVSTMLVDADPYGGAVAQHLGILDEVSGLLSAARRANAGQLGINGLNEVARSLDGGLRVLTGLPRADRWAEVRPAAFTEILDCAEGLVDQVVLDLGFSLEDAQTDPFAASPRRNETTLSALERAGDVVVVGSADPVGLSRLARGLVELRELLPTVPLHVVVNRTRSTLGWSQAEVGAMIESFVRPVRTHYLPEDRTTVDRALTSGRSLAELGDSPLRQGISQMADTLLGSPSGVRRRGRWRRQASKSR
ncbi:P-loop NTPase [soil metagenome]